MESNFFWERKFLLIFNYQQLTLNGTSNRSILRGSIVGSNDRTRPIKERRRDPLSLKDPSEIG